jgi:hypothetical protein
MKTFYKPCPTEPAIYEFQGEIDDDGILVKADVKHTKAYLVREGLQLDVDFFSHISAARDRLKQDLTLRMQLEIARLNEKLEKAQSVEVTTIPQKPKNKKSN